MKKVVQLQKNENKTVIFQAKNGALELRGDSKAETLWASQAQIAEVFEVSIKTINEHIVNIYKASELIESGTIRKFRIVQTEGKRNVEREVLHYNLDLIISVGYRVNSMRATQFRQWATGVLKQYTTQGFAINKKIIKSNLDAFVRFVTPLLPSGDVFSPEQTLELVTLFSDTWISLDNYDRDNLVHKKVTKKSVKLTADDLIFAISEFRQELLRNGTATDIFAIERSVGNVSGIVGNEMQSFGGVPMYDSIESKAAHLLYFIIKNHPFVDGNKRSGAFAFVWFLNRARVLDTASVTPLALTALTLLVAESKPTDKDQIVRLIISLMSKKYEK